MALILLLTMFGSGLILLWPPPSSWETQMYGVACACFGYAFHELRRWSAPDRRPTGEGP